MKNRVGEKHRTNQGYEIKIIEYFSSKNCTVKFEDGTLVRNKEYKEILKGKVRKHDHPILCNIGFIGFGKHNSKNSKKYYQVWSSMIKRAYSGSHPSYKNVTVCEDWHNFQNFVSWISNKWNTEYMDKTWHLDKDILIKSNKIYSTETCCFVPSEINSLIIRCDKSRGDLPIGVSLKRGAFVAQINKFNSIRTHIGSFQTPMEAFQAYKIEKEKYIKEMADKWESKLESQVHKSLLNYKVEITD